MLVFSPQSDNGPAAKKRKLGPANSGVTAQPSFADVLEKLKDEHVSGNGASIKHSVDYNL